MRTVAQELAVLGSLRVGDKMVGLVSQMEPVSMNSPVPKLNRHDVPGRLPLLPVPLL